MTTRTAGVAGTFPITFSHVPVEPPTLTIYSDVARTIVAVPTAALVATANPAVWTASYPATLPAGRYYLVISAVYTVGQPAYLDQDDTLDLTAPNATVGGGLVTLEQVKAHLFDDPARIGNRHDAELRLLIDAATPIIENITGPVLPRQVVETIRGTVLRERPVLSVLSITRGAVVVDPAQYTLTAASGLLNGRYLLGATVTYTAGYAVVPPNVVRAALRWITWSWRRDHGGSETYTPGGDDATIPGPGVRGIEAELRMILDPQRRGAKVP